MKKLLTLTLTLTLFWGSASLTQGQSAQFDNLSILKKLQIPQFTSLPGTVVPRGLAHVTATADSGLWVGAANGSRWIRAGSGSGGTGSGSGWSYSGDTVTSLQFLGTLTNEDLVLKRFGTQVARFQYNRLNIGSFAGDSANATGQVNIGFKAGVGATNAPYMSSNGFYSGYKAVNASYATWLGPYSGNEATSAYWSTGLGYSALAFADSAYQATGVGYQSLWSARKARFATAVGANAGSGATNAEYSTIVGTSAAYNSLNLSYSTVLGAFASQQTSGRRHISLGYRAGSGFSANDPGDNNIVIGNNISVPDSAYNTANIGGALYIKNIINDTASADPIVTATTNARVGINTNNPHATAQLDLEGTKGGLGLPKMTTAQRDSLVSPRTGLMIYNTSIGTTQTYSGSAWQTAPSASTGRLQQGNGITITSSGGGSLTGIILGTDTFTISVADTVAVAIANGFKGNDAVVGDTLYLNSTWYKVDSVSVGVGTFQVWSQATMVLNAVSGGFTGNMKLSSESADFSLTRLYAPNLANHNNTFHTMGLLVTEVPTKIYLQIQRTDGAGSSNKSAVSAGSNGTKIMYIQVD